MKNQTTKTESQINRNDSINHDMENDEGQTEDYKECMQKHSCELRNGKRCASQAMIPKGKWCPPEDSIPKGGWRVNSIG